MAEGIGQKEHGGNETGGTHKEHDYVMVGEDSSREQVCTRLHLSNAKHPTPVMQAGTKCSLSAPQSVDV